MLDNADNRIGVVYKQKYFRHYTDFFAVPESQTETFTGCSKGILARN